MERVDEGEGRGGVEVDVGSGVLDGVVELEEVIGSWLVVIVEFVLTGAVELAVADAVGVPNSDTLS